MTNISRVQLTSRQKSVPLTVDIEKLYFVRFFKIHTTLFAKITESIWKSQEQSCMAVKKSGIL